MTEPSAEAFLETSTEVQLSNSSQASSSCSRVLFFPEGISTKRRQKERMKSNIPLCFTFYLLFIFYFISFFSLLSMMQTSTANNKREKKGTGYFF